MNNWNLLRTGDYVRISLEYSEQSLQGQTGQIIGLPEEEGSCQYLLVLDGGFFRSPSLANKRLLIDCHFLDLA